MENGNGKWKVNIKGVRRIRITGDYIKLDALLKYASVASTGGEAKIMIQSGEVFVNSDRSTARGKKIKPGDIVRCGSSVFLIDKYDN